MKLWLGLMAPAVALGIAGFSRPVKAAGLVAAGKATATLAEDPNWHGFERIGSVLSLSPAHVEKYFAAAEGVLAEAFPEKASAKLDQHWDALDLRGGPDRKLLKEQGLLEKVRVDVWPGST